MGAGQVDPTGYCAAAVGTRIRECRTVSAIYPDGRVDKIGTVNINSDADRASMRGTIAAYQANNGLTFSNGADVRVSVHHENEAPGSDLIKSVGETRDQRADRIAREVITRDSIYMFGFVGGSAAAGGMLAGGVFAISAALPEIQALAFSLQLAGTRFAPLAGDVLAGEAIGGHAFAHSGGMLVRGAPVIWPATLAALGQTASRAKVDVAAVISSPQSLWGRSASEIAEAFVESGYEASVRQSTRGSGLAEIVTVRGHPHVTQIQVHPGGGRHGGSYIKVSTNTEGTLKVVDPATYRANPGERARIVSHSEILE